MPDGINLTGFVTCDQCCLFLTTILYNVRSDARDALPLVTSLYR